MCSYRDFLEVAKLNSLEWRSSHASVLSLAAFSFAVT